MRSMLIDILEKVFTDNDYALNQVLKEMDEYKAFLASTKEEKERSEFFLLIEPYDPTDALLKKVVETEAEDFHIKLNASDLTDETFKKNCTMIICCKDLVSQSSILSLEEDPYNFKKNVIVYSQEELDDLIQKGITNFSSDKLNELVNEENGNHFREFKSEPESNYYEILLKMVIKLPFIKYTIPQKQLYNLEEDIVDKLTEPQRLTLQTALNIDLSTSEDDEIYKKLFSDGGYSIE